MDAAVQASITRLLLEHEIGGDAGLPYRLSFAGKGNSGASFGATQGDLNTNTECRPVFITILNQRGDVTAFGTAKRQAVFAALIGKPNPCDPFGDAGKTVAAINAALDHPASRPQIDAMDKAQLGRVLAMVGVSAAMAAAAGRNLAPACLAALALYCNQFGAPNTANQWFSGQTVTLNGKAVPPPPPGPLGLESLLGYIGQTKYYSQNPKNFQRFCTIARSFAVNPPESPVNQTKAGPLVGV